MIRRAALYGKGYYVPCTLIGLFLGLLLYFPEHKRRFVPRVVLSAIAAVLLVVFLVVLPPIRYVRWCYELHDDYLDIAKGIIWRKRYIIPFIRVQNTDTRQGPILRAFGLSSVTVATAAGEHVIPGLANDVADQVRDRAAELARIAREDM